ncbi:MAG: pyridoxal phosphate-dependent aminotransferase [Bdellovibrionota bacterium]
MIPQRVAGSSTLAMLEKVRQMKAQGVDVVSFAAGESDFPTPTEVIEESYKEMKAGNTRYVSTQGVPILREELAKDYKNRLNVSWAKPEDFLVVAGAKQGIHLVLSALCEAGDDILIPAPYWVSYPGIVKALLGNPKVITTDIEHRYFPSVEQLEKSWTPKSKALIMASPGNPTGMMIEEKHLKEIIKWCREKKVVLIFDELYERLTFGNTKHVCALSLVTEEESEWVVSVNAFSKTFGMTGWRLGWVASHPTNIQRLTDLQSQVLTCMPGFAQVAAARAMKDMDSIIAPVVDAFGKRKQLIMETLKGVDGVSLLEPEGAFYVLVNVEGVIKKKGLKDDKDFVQQLLEKEQVVTVAGSSFGAPGNFRISFAMGEAEIKKGLERIKRFCA